MSLIERLKELVSPITDEIKAGDLDPADVVEQLGNEAAVDLLGIEALSVDPDTFEEVAEPEPVIEPIVEPETELTEELAAVNPLVEELAAQRAKTDALEAQLKAEKLERRKRDLSAEAEAFKALPIEADEFVEKVMALEDVDPELAKWLQEKLSAFDAMLMEAGLLRELGSELDANLGDVDRFLKIVETVLAEEFSGDRGKYSDALAKASMKHPKLAEAYSEQFVR